MGRDQDEPAAAVRRLSRRALDPDADVARRAWLPCPQCPRGRDCPTCRGGRSCDRHWSYLLGIDGRQIFVQCNGCRHRWWHDTGFGAGNRPAHLDRLVPPPQRHVA